MNKIYQGETQTKILLAECIRVPTKEEIEKFRLHFFDGVKKGDVYCCVLDKADTNRYIFFEDERRFSMTRLGFKKYFQIKNSIKV